MSTDDPTSGADDRPAWRPVMSLADAERWSRDSNFPRRLFHATSRTAAESIRRKGFDLRQRNFGRAWGLGIYTTPDRGVADVYRGVVSYGEPIIIELRVDVRRVLSIVARPGETRAELRNRVLDLVPDGRSRWYLEAIAFRALREVDAAAMALGAVLLAAGYDALDIEEPVMSPEIGGSQLVVFSPRAVVVIDNV